MSRRPLPPASDAPLRRPAPGLGAWLRAWRKVVLSPDLPMPEPLLPPEGQPIPADLDLHCPECGRSITGLREWCCPACGQRFSLKQAWTVKIQSDPEYWLRYRFSPGDVRCVIAIVLVLAATLPAVWHILHYSPPRASLRLDWLHRKAWRVIFVPPALAVGYILRGEWSLRGLLGLSLFWCLLAWLAFWRMQ